MRRSARDIRAYAPVVEATVEAVVDEALAGGSRRDGFFDLMTDVAQQFPIAVIRDLLGIEGGDARRFAQIGSEVGQSLDGVRTVASARNLRAGSDELAALFAGLAKDAHVRVEHVEDEARSGCQVGSHGSEATQQIGGFVQMKQ